LVEARHDGLACWWTRAGAREAVEVSPDTGPHGGRAQRVAVKAPGQGIAQWTYLPLHRVRRFEFEIFLRSPDLTAISIALSPPGAGEGGARARVVGVSGAWQRFTGTLELEAGLPAGVGYRLAVTAEGAGQFVLQRCLLRPADHENGADPDVVRWLRESRLPILRWPGGNFVSAYHWEEGIGLPEQRPTVPNYAWGAVETHLFGTDEFLAFCRAVGCEPMICVNAGNGTPAEAARWVQYCNGSVDTPMGARRAAHGHPEPYRVRHWEVGNELWGRWQAHWTTAAGYVDRYRQFAQAMLAADSSIELYACGAPVFWGKAWNDTLIAGVGSALGILTDHPLIGGNVPATTDPLEVYRDFMAVPDVLAEKWRALERDLAGAGLARPRLAVTELQLFAHLDRAGRSATEARLTPETLVSPGTLAEALYDVLIYHAAVRLAPFIPLVTHSATVNHGGGLRKERERVYANPCHYAQATFAAFAGATPVQVALGAPVERAPRVLPELRNVVAERTYPAVDALAALAPDGSLLLSIVHRGVAGPIRLAVELPDFRSASTAEVRTLAAERPWAANSLSHPEAVRPIDRLMAVGDGGFTLELPLYSVSRVRLPPRAAGRD
jgi:alpha-N-arabinofuranosidase